MCAASDEFDDEFSDATSVQVRLDLFQLLFQRAQTHGKLLGVGEGRHYLIQLEG